MAGSAAGQSSPTVNPHHTDMANAIRALAMDAVEAANSGHPGMPLGMADVATVLFTQFLKFDPAHPDWADRDRFILSAGHGSMLLYALLYLTGYPGMTLDDIKSFRKLGAKTAGHPEYGHAPGIETTTGPLGQGIANSVGFALAERIMAARFGSDLVDHYTYVVAGDGCLMEGISHEAISLAGHLKLGKLIVLFDDNGISIDGPTSLSVSDDQLGRFRACGWDVQSVDGHDPAAVAAAIAHAKTTATPSLIACKTIIGFGAPSKAGKASSHGSPLGSDEIAGARAALGWPYGPFEIPDPILGAWREAGRRGAAEHAVWAGRLLSQPAAARGEFERRMAGLLPTGWRDALNAHMSELIETRPKLATRAASGNVLDVLCEAVPELIGGSADLTGSNNTKAKTALPISAPSYDGRYIYYGVREHGMAAAMNGLALHGGVIPFGGTFLVFADYCRGAIRLSSLMGIRVIYVLTHDSIGLGEDGPTHQPVETLASLRAMPNLHVFRPADAVETAECWAAALEAKTTPSVLALTRQAVPAVRVTASDENRSAKGAYVLLEAQSGTARAVLLASGSEVHLALEAADTLEAGGIPTRVVSVPCWELFDAQDETYRAAVLGPVDGVRVACEAGIALGWERYVGPAGGFVGMTGFGASGPAGDLYAHFGLTASAIVAAVKQRL